MTESASGFPGFRAPEHDWVARKVGEWDVECFYYLVPGEDPTEVKGTETVEALGEYWAVGEFRCNVFGGDVVGRSTIGFDPERAVFTGAWHDSTTPFLYLYEGTLDASQAVLEMRGDNIDPLTRQMAQYRSVDRYQDSNHRTLELSVQTAEGEEVTVLRYVYSRRS